MTTRLYASNLAAVTLKRDLDILFGSFSKTVSAKLIRDKITHEPNGSAFINMFNYEEACSAAKALNGTEFLGKAIEVVLSGARKIKPRFSIQYRC